MVKTKVTRLTSTKPAHTSTTTYSRSDLFMLVGPLFVLMAILQLISFSDFKDALATIGLSSPATWAVVLILVEIWGASSFSKFNIHSMFRAVGSYCAILVSGFWFFENIRVIADDTFMNINNIGFFGRFLAQKPGWWTVVEASIVLFWILWAIGLTRYRRSE